MTEELGSVLNSVDTVDAAVTKFGACVAGIDLTAPTNGNRKLIYQRKQWLLSEPSSTNLKVNEKFSDTTIRLNARTLDPSHGCAGSK